MSGFGQVVIGQGMALETPDVVQQCLASAELSREAGKLAWALAFCGGRHDPDVFCAGLRSGLGSIPVLGGAAVGTITASSLGYSGYEAAVALFPEELPLLAIHDQELEGVDEFAAGRKLGETLSVYPDGSVILLFYDSVKSANPVQLHIGSRLLDGIYDSLGDKPLHIVGGGTLADFNFSGAYVFDGRNAQTHCVVAAVLPTAIAAHTRIFHGCVPASSFMTITRIEGAVVYELDGRPALDVLKSILGEDFFSERGGQLTLTATLGAKQGNLFAPYDESAYVNRLILSHNPADGSITLFEPDFTVGSRIQVMSRNNSLMLDSIRAAGEVVRNECADKSLLLGLYVNCAGRSSMVSGADTEEAGVLFDDLKATMPLLGFYSGVEFAPVSERSRPLDWTGVLTVLYRKDVA